MIPIHFLLLAMIIGAIIAIEVKDLLSSVVAVGTVGLGFAFICLILKAPDVAMTQLVVEIFGVIILIRATIKADLPNSISGDSLATGAIGCLFLTVLVVFSVHALSELAPFGSPLMRASSHYAANSVAETGAANAVSAILLNYRAYDTLGEATVLFAAAIGVLAVTRSLGRVRHSENGIHKDGR